MSSTPSHPLLTDRYVTETAPGKRPRLSFVTINDQFTVDVAAEEVGHLDGDPRSLCFPIVGDGKPVIWTDFDSFDGYTMLLEDALKVAAMEIAALRLLATSPSSESSDQ
ncbi:hypothetical protein [Cryobacterium zhongshanensis]|uniref:Uncharacterized protein n=1 Tax=Cryobacterium zhongshanensis TaxID=2928153 RepID=A0AA41UHA9_9MICO|nr:hypothetical protein [Cryobacterium zhongshanensis]MCI4659720.1 hypothetical protein [Cryobacterium zhongshanensis]